ncbi:hypothetical protein [Pseudoalteromonas tunicata]|jgi:hypothetical protein|uniref:Uncharacterized protein n=1 Tax=Pseudoalteromonas tunicata D2 TaxID=87626 RepID=A4C8Q8_9GAMM|nr:hypothetical protein [Pseudoalteromonas tunicata]ATC93476.1 hypothetical protein PTUN_a0727 [Pseudoalteromonas tunicata]AXT32516.1 hypothetical protein D1819_17895 [Pseudoalteromonas tunicata]EAR28973.1 hypothetical protein PTD2_08014 [Pseudoalteromonas tunicata D2]
MDVVNVKGSNANVLGGVEQSKKVKAQDVDSVKISVEASNVGTVKISVEARALLAADTGGNGVEPPKSKSAVTPAALDTGGNGVEPPSVSADTGGNGVEPPSVSSDTGGNGVEPPQAI